MQFTPFGRIRPENMSGIEIMYLTFLAAIFLYIQIKLPLKNILCICCRRTILVNIKPNRNF